MLVCVLFAKFSPDPFSKLEDSAVRSAMEARECMSELLMLDHKTSLYEFAQSTIRDCMSYDPEARPSANALVEILGDNVLNLRRGRLALPKKGVDSN